MSWLFRNMSSIACLEYFLMTRSLILTILSPARCIIKTIRTIYIYFGFHENIRHDLPTTTGEMECQSCRNGNESTFGQKIDNSHAFSWHKQPKFHTYSPFQHLTTQSHKISHIESISSFHNTITQNFDLYSQLHHLIHIHNHKTQSCLGSTLPLLDKLVEEMGWCRIDLVCWRDGDN